MCSILKRKITPNNNISMSAFYKFNTKQEWF